MLVIIEHKSKFAYAAHLRNKTSTTVANVMRQVLLPMCLSRPKRCLSDNGPEFVCRVFEQMLGEQFIEHVRTTPYVPL